MAAQLVFVVGVDKTSNQVNVLIVTISSNSNCVHALDCLLGGGCTSALLVLGGVYVDADGGCGLVRTYVVLVKIFITNSKKRYYILFTVLSYGIMSL